MIRRPPTSTLFPSTPLFRSLERRPERRPRARRSLDEDAYLARHQGEAIGVAARVALQPCGALVDVVPGVRHDPGDAERPAALQLAREASHAFVAQPLIR